MRKAYDFNYRDMGTVPTYTKADLIASLRNAEKLGEWPPIIRVDASMPPISSPGSGAHFLTVTGISADGNTLAVDNTWEDGKDFNGNPSVQTSTIEASIRSANIALPSEASALMPRVNYFKQNPGQEEKLIHKWLAMPDNLKAAGAVSPADYERKNPDPDLHLWVSDHPEDKDLSFWKKCIEQWLEKYPINSHKP
ncbi:hypothetical protein BH11CYA1_BH11CYA1_03540 [soil metagenome]